jgi:hypothetical protein
MISCPADLSHGGGTRAPSRGFWRAGAAAVLSVPRVSSVLARPVHVPVDGGGCPDSMRSAGRGGSGRGRRARRRLMCAVASAEGTRASAPSSVAGSESCSSVSTASGGSSTSSARFSPLATRWAASCTLLGPRRPGRPTRSKRRAPRSPQRKVSERFIPPSNPAFKPALGGRLPSQMEKNARAKSSPSTVPFTVPFMSTSMPAPGLWVKVSCCPLLISSSSP